MEGIPSNNTETKKEENTVETREGNVFRIAVDYGKSIEEMIIDGRYDQVLDVNSSVSFEVTNKKREVVEFESHLFSFDRVTSKEEVEEEIEREGKDNPWIPAKIEHLLSFGATFPDKQREYPIICLGSLGLAKGVEIGWTGARGEKVPHVAYLGTFSEHGSIRGVQRILSDQSLRFEFFPNCRFLAVRPVRT